jgi:hypothetical protein
MKPILFIIAALALTLALAPVVPAQSPITRPGNVAPQHDPFKLDWGDAVYWGGSIADTASSIGQGESNPLARNSQGIFSPAKAVTLQASAWGVMKLVEWKYPESRRRLFWVKVGVGVVSAVFAVRNKNYNRRR